MFRNYTESGPTLMTTPDRRITGRFVLEGTSTTIANTLRRAILTETRSVGFRADLSQTTNPGIQIRKNTSVIFNEMLAHRLTLLPLGVVRVDEFDPTRYECILRIKNERKGPIDAANMLHVKASDFTVREKQADGTFETLPTPAVQALFPADPITKDTTLLVSLRPQWNIGQPAEEIDLTAYPVIGTGREHMGFCPVAQCSFGNTLDTDPVRQDSFFQAWLRDFKKVSDSAALAPEALDNYKKEWSTISIQRCFLVNERGEPSSFDFTIESVGIRPVPDLVAEGIQAVIRMVEPYVSLDTGSAGTLGVATQPVDSRMNGLDVVFQEQEHTLGNLLQTILTEMYLDTEAPDAPITFAGYKVRHPLHRVLTLRLGFREGLQGDQTAIAFKLVADAAQRAKTIFEDLGRSWAAVQGTGAAVAEAQPELEG
jgi:DNA-directed RNA polymerase subunit L